LTTPTGKLRHRLILQSPTQTQGSTGEVTITYSTSTTVWGSLRPLTGKEIEAAGQVSAELNYRAEIRYNGSIATEWRISHDSKTYEVIAVLNIDEINNRMILDLKRIE